MQSQHYLEELVQQWRERRLRGEEVPLEELCRDCPELLGEVRRHVDELDRLARLAPWLDTNTGDPVPAAATTGNAGEAPSFEFLAPPQMPDEVGRLGGFRVLGLLGQGGMGMVLLAEDPLAQRRIALKVMKPGSASSPQDRARFLREARAAAALEHDNIVPIYQVGEENDVLFVAMPQLKGATLDQRLKQPAGTPPVADIVQVARQVAAGLAAAHQRGLIHRDIKPSNLWLEQRPGDASAPFRVKILDFGLARPAEEPGLTQPALRASILLGRLRPDRRSEVTFVHQSHVNVFSENPWRNRSTPFSSTSG